MNVKEQSLFISKRMARAILDYNMIQDGDNILIAVSGGKDSLTLAYHMPLLKKSLPYDFNFHAIHVRSDFPGCPKDDKMQELLADWDIPFTIIDVPVMERLKPGKKMNCYWCSTQRRMELLRFSEANGYNKIALGHHMDDILETLLMNMAYKGEVATMLPVMPYDKFPQIVIRPLSLVKEKTIISFTNDLGILSFTCSCPYGQTSKRKPVREAIELLANDSPTAKENLFKAMSNINSKYLPSIESK